MEGEFTQEFRETCIDSNIECVEREPDVNEPQGIDRVLDVLSTVMWRGLERKQPTFVAQEKPASHPPQKQQVSTTDMEQAETLDGLISRIRQTVEQSSTLSDSERRARAAIVAMDLLKALDLDDDDDNDNNEM